MFNSTPLFQILAVMGSVFIILSLIELVRRRRLKENYSLLWFAIAFVFLIFSLKRDLLTWLANLLGVDYAPAAIFLLLIAALYLLSLNFSIVLSGLSERNKELAQKTGLLEMEIKKIKEKTEK